VVFSLFIVDTTLFLEYGSVAVIRAVAGIIPQ